MANDFLSSIRVLAIRAVEQKDSDYLVRHICRWYSKEYSTPLAEVEEIPLEDLLQHYFEVRYEHMDDVELEQEAKKLCETETERAAREKAEADADESDEAFYKEAAAKAAKDHTRTRFSRPPDHDAKPITKMPDLTANLPNAPKDKSIRQIPEGIKMTFAEDEDMDKVEAWDLLGNIKPDKEE